MKKDSREILIESIGILQKEVFNIPKLEQNLISLYSYPTSYVDKFFNKIERLYEIKLEYRPDTVSRLVDLIMSNTEGKWWE